jgi:hypothetical protein
VKKFKENNAMMVKIVYSIGGAAHYSRRHLIEIVTGLVFLNTLVRVGS